MMGIADRFLDEGHRVRGISLYARGRRLLGIDMAHNGSAYPFVLHLPNPHRGAAAGAGRRAGRQRRDRRRTASISRRYGTSVSARVRDVTGREHIVTAGFVVGCDGAHSRVRHLLGAPFTGQPYPWDWVLADAHLDWPGSPNEVHVFHPSGRTSRWCASRSRRSCGGSPSRAPGDRGGVSADAGRGPSTSSTSEVPAASGSPIPRR